MQWPTIAAAWRLGQNLMACLGLQNKPKTGQFSETLSQDKRWKKSWGINLVAGHLPIESETRSTREHGWHACVTLPRMRPVLLLQLWMHARSLAGSVV